MGASSLCLVQFMPRSFLEPDLRTGRATWRCVDYFVTTGIIPNVVSESMIGSWLNGLDRGSRVSMMERCWYGERQSKIYCGMDILVCDDPE